MLSLCKNNHGVLHYFIKYFQLINWEICVVDRFISKNCEGVWYLLILSGLLRI